MANNERVSAILTAMTNQDNAVLQNLFSQAAIAGVSSSTIIRIWYRQADLARQPQKVIDFLYNTLVTDSQLERPSQEPVDLKFFRKNKLDFMDDESVPASIRRRCSPLFDGLYEIELANNQDIAEMDHLFLAKSFEVLGHYNRKYIASALSSINQYLKWSVRSNNPTHECWKAGEVLVPDDIDTAEAMRQSCYRDAKMLRDVIEERIDIDNMQTAPPLAVLAWMDFDLETALAITNDDVSLSNKSICGRKIPEELVEIIKRYYLVGDSFVMVGAGNGAQRQLHVEDLGLFLKPRTVKPKGVPVNASAAKNALSSNGLSYKDIQMSSRYCRLHEISAHRLPTEEDVCAIFGIDANDKAWKVQNEVGTRLLEYQSFVRAFY